MIPHSSITSTLDFYLTNAKRNRTPERERGFDCGLRLNLQKLSSFSSVCPQCGLVVNTRKGFIMTCPAGFFSIGHLCRNPAVHSWRPSSSNHRVAASAEALAPAACQRETQRAKCGRTSGRISGSRCIRSRESGQGALGREDRLNRSGRLSDRAAHDADGAKFRVETPLVGEHLKTSSNVIPVTFLL